MTLNWYVFPEPSGSFATAAANCSKASNGAYQIKINFLSNSSDQQRISLVRRLAAGDSSIDILAMDVDWTAEFADAKWIRPWTGTNAAAVSKGVLPGPLKTATWNGRLYAAPINSNTQLLWYRKDLVPHPPKTWNQMIDDAIQLAKEGKPHYIEEQGAKYEGLTVWFNSLVNSAGGQILSPNNKILVDHTSETAAEIMKRLADSPAADPALNVAMEGSVGDELGARYRRVPDQLPVRLVSGQGRQPERVQAHGLCALPERDPRRCAARFDRWLQPRGLDALQASAARVPGDPLPGPAGQSSP